MIVLEHHPIMPSALITKSYLGVAESGKIAFFLNC
jgi:hypothetical protein